MRIMRIIPTLARGNVCCAASPARALLHGECQRAAAKRVAAAVGLKGQPAPRAPGHFIGTPTSSSILTLELLYWESCEKTNSYSKI